MTPGRASQTAVMVAMARALADARSPVTRFSDPTALALLPDDARTKVERHRAGVPPRGLRARAERAFAARRADMMVVRTVAIDDAVRAAGAPQVVILGAGLDGRAWRMPELAAAVVFEVDHPDTQRDKRARAAALTVCAREVRFVAVDFTRDDLDVALASAGHDAARPTTWIWEGVVMYLTPAEVARSLALIARRSAPGSRLIVAYLAPSVAAHLVGLLVRRVGEPLRSTFSREVMAATLGRHGFAVLDDGDLPTLAAALDPTLARTTRPMRHLRIVTAARRG